MFSHSYLWVNYTKKEVTSKYDIFNLLCSKWDKSDLIRKLTKRNFDKYQIDFIFTY